MTDELFSGRYPAKRGNGEHTGPGEWLDVIHAANGVCDGLFGRPESTGPWWAGGEVEEYAEARVIHRRDGSVSIVAKTERASAALTQAHAQVTQA